MMKIPDEFMAPDRSTCHMEQPQAQLLQPPQNSLRRGSLDDPKPVFKVWVITMLLIIPSK